MTVTLTSRFVSRKQLTNIYGASGAAVSCMLVLIKHTPRFVGEISDRVANNVDCYLQVGCSHPQPISKTPAFSAFSQYSLQYFASSVVVQSQTP